MSTRPLGRYVGEKTATFIGQILQEGLLVARCNGCRLRWQLRPVFCHTCNAVGSQAAETSTQVQWKMFAYLTITCHSNPYHIQAGSPFYQKQHQAPLVDRSCLLAYMAKVP